MVNELFLMPKAYHIVRANASIQPTEYLMLDLRRKIDSPPLFHWRWGPSPSIIFSAGYSYNFILFHLTSSFRFSLCSFLALRDIYTHPQELPVSLNLLLLAVIFLHLVCDFPTSGRTLTSHINLRNPSNSTAVSSFSCLKSDYPSAWPTTEHQAKPPPRPRLSTSTSRSPIITTRSSSKSSAQHS